MNEESPVFIIGNPRSGTSLLRLMLTCHSEVVIPPESGFLVWWYEKYKDWNIREEKYDLNEFVEDLLDSKKIEFWNLDKLELLAMISSKKPSTYSELMSLIYHHYAEKTERKYSFWGDKNNFYLNHVGLLLKLYPGAKFIHIVRDGRDVATSYLKLNNINHDSEYSPNLPKDIESIAKEWSNNILTINKSFEDIPLGQKLELKYESLVLSPTKSLEGVCEFLKVPFEVTMLDFYLANSKNSLEPNEFKTWKSKTFTKLNSSAINQFTAFLTKNQKLLFERIAIDALKLYNY